MLRSIRTVSTISVIHSVTATCPWVFAIQSTALMAIGVPRGSSIEKCLRVLPYQVTHLFDLLGLGHPCSIVDGKKVMPRVREENSN